MSKTALWLAALLLLTGDWSKFAQAQKPSCGGAQASQSSSAPAAPSASQAQSGTDASSRGSKANSKDTKSKADKAKAGAATADGKGCSPDQTQPCADAPQPNSGGASQTDQFAFPEDISRKAAQAAGSGLPDNATPNAAGEGSPLSGARMPGAPMPGAQGSGAGSAGEATSGANSGSGNPFGGAGASGTPSGGVPASGGNPFPLPPGKAVSTPGWGGLRRRGEDPNDPNGSVPADPSSNSSSSSDPGSGGAGSGSSGPNGPPAHDSPKLQLQDAGSSGQMVDSYRAETDDDVADFYNKNGNYLGAYMRYEDAVHFNPDDEPAQYGLAEMAQKLGHTQEAIEHYQAYLKMAPSGSRAKEAERAIKRMAVSSSK